jgi:hypothetical protein
MLQIVWIPAALYLLLYAPGHYVLRGVFTAAQTPGSRLLREVLFSTCCASWLGFLLAEFGLYRLSTLLVLLAAVALVARALLGRSGHRRYRSIDLLGLGVAALTWLWVAPPLDTSILGSDSAGYAASGVHLSRHGSLIIHDPTLPRLSPDLKRALFPSVAPNRGAPPYLRLGGSMVLRSLDSDEVLPAFFHLIAVWIAVFHGLAGPRGAQWVITLFAGLSVWAIVEFARSVGGNRFAAVCGLLLLLLAPQYWYSRFLMPEVPAQYFLWGGLCCLSFAERSGRWADAVLAGCAFGLAGLMRIENAAFLLVALTVVLWITPREARRAGYIVLGCAGALWVHAALHLAIFRTHYFGNLHVFVRDSLPATLGGLRYWQALLVCAGFAAVWLWRRRRAAPALARTTVGAILTIGVAGVALWTDAQHGWSSLRVLAAYCGLPTLAAGGVGVLVCSTRLRHQEFAARLLVVLTAVVFAQVVIDPHATPIPIWMLRRAVAVVLPALCLGLAFLCEWGAQRWHWSVAAALFVLGVAGEVPPLQQLRLEPYYVGGLRHVQALATLIPPGARLLFDSRIVSSGLPPALWAQRDLPAYLVAGNDLAHIRELARQLDGAPLFWLSSGTTPPPQGEGITATPIALYEFLLTTPALDVGSTPLTSINWDYTVGLYSLRVEGPPVARLGDGWRGRFVPSNAQEPRRAAGGGSATGHLFVRARVPAGLRPTEDGTQKQHRRVRHNPPSAAQRRRCEGWN